MEVLHQRIQTVWDQLNQRVIDRAVLEWRIRLRACVKAKGGYFVLFNLGLYDMCN